MDDPAPQGASGWLFGPASTWHVSPAVDLSCYAFAWVAMAVPVAGMLGQNHPNAFMLFILTTLITDLHRHYTLPYVYMDAHVRGRFPMRFFLLPAAFFALWSQTPSLSRSAMPVSWLDVGALLSWSTFAVQLMRQDRGGEFQIRVALPCLLVPLAAASAITMWARESEALTLDWSWAWALAAPLGSIVLHRCVSADDPGDMHSGTRAPVTFPLVASSAALLGALGSFVAGGGSAAGLSIQVVFNFVLILFLLWHFYHVLMQKYGILRIYSAKSGLREKVPGWVDRWLLFSFLPLFFVWVSLYELGSLVDQLGYERRGLGQMVFPALRSIASHSDVLLVGSFLFILASVGTFAYYEWKLHGFRNRPRLWFALGTLSFYSTFFYLGVFSFYSVFSFAHGIEYMVFIWAFQRKRYSARPEHARALSRFVQHPIAFYATLTVVVVGLIALARYGHNLSPLGFAASRIFGETPFEWVRWYTVYQGILHFYYDGFLWKLRRPELSRAM